MTGFKNVTPPCKSEGKFLVAVPWFGAVKVSILKQGFCISVWVLQELIAMASSFKIPASRYGEDREARGSLSLLFFLSSKYIVMFYPIFFSCNECCLHTYYYYYYWYYAAIHHMIASPGLIYNSTLNLSDVKVLWQDSLFCWNVRKLHRQV